MKSSNKLKMLCLIDILETLTDEEHPMSASGICMELERRGISAERKSIYRDIATLTEYGYDIVYTHSPHPGYFMASRSFELAEIKMLADAVQAAGSITPSKTAELIEKLGGLVSKYQFEDISSQVYIDKRVKNSNEEIYYNIDIISKAISKGKKIRFKYIKRSIADNRIESSVKDMIISPYAMIWSNDHYYLVGNNDKYDNLIHLRIDRMKNVKIMISGIRPFSEVSDYTDKFDAADYAGRTFNMFGGTKQTVELRCANSMLEQIIDRFGDGVPLRKSGSEHFVLYVDALISEGLISWIMQYGASIEVLSPRELRKSITERIMAVSSVYKLGNAD